MESAALHRRMFHFSEFMRLANCVFYQQYNPFANEVNDFRNTPTTMFKGNGLPGIYARVKSTV